LGINAKARTEAFPVGFRVREENRLGQQLAKEVGMGNPAEETIRHPNLD